ncbi:MAG: hypothetical protein LQ338_008310, partial [Usnochroma carphineum]
YSAMRLLNTKTLDFREFFDSGIPKYAILSHRWGSDEATFQDFEKGVQQSRKGYAKIRQCCKLASRHAYHWAWVDTCCIDKKSSAELTEAINSMYNWYGEAEVCYVYLEDVLWKEGTSGQHAASMQLLSKSSWFTRGWTLQELLAPRKVLFHDQNWQLIGTKEDLAHEISEISGIDVQHLLPWPQIYIHEPCTKAPDCRQHNPTSVTSSRRFSKVTSVATRMSWASNRRTSRVEDMAYCLLGIFNVNMPLLYGEGRKAFMRLQHEIIKQSDDDSIFAWRSDDAKVLPGYGVFARRPSDFAGSRYVYLGAPLKTRRRPYTLTNQGLHLPITWRAWGEDKGGEVLKVPLDCGMCGPEGFKTIVLYFTQLPGGIWWRVGPEQLETMEEGSWHNPVSGTQSSPAQDLRTSHQTETGSEKKPGNLQSPAYPLSELGEIMVKADWEFDYFKDWVWPIPFSEDFDMSSIDHDSAGGRIISYVA